MTEKDKNNVGRPTKYSSEIAEEICVRLAMGESLIKICKDQHMPHRKTVMYWAYTPNHEFCDTYKRAREMQQEHFLDEIIEIADDSSQDFENGEFNREHVQRSKLRIETRRWIMERLGQKLYGNKQQIDHKSTDGTMTPAPVVALTDEQLQSFNKKFDEQY